MSLRVWVLSTCASDYFYAATRGNKREQIAFFALLRGPLALE
jgi:hypothetical protein